MHTVTFSHRFLLFGSKLEFPWDCGTIQSHAKTSPCARSQSALLLYCCEDVKSHHSGGDTVPLTFKSVL